MTNSIFLEVSLMTNTKAYNIENEVYILFSSMESDSTLSGIVPVFRYRPTVVLASWIFHLSPNLIFALSDSFV
jgi:hypothetical protein